MIKAFILTIILDTVLGDPVYRLHPVRLMGDLINLLDKHFNQEDVKPAKLLKLGALTVFLCLSAVALVYGALSYFGSGLLGDYYWILEGVLVYQLLATRCLYDEGVRIKGVLAKENIKLAQQQIGYLVSRDTDELTLQQIYKAAIETLTENTTDGIVAPVLYYSIFGLVGIAVYKMINTLDSMIAYKNKRYLYFGRVAAKVDDAVNYIPARIAALYIIILAFIFKDNYVDSARCFKAHRKLHASPNAGCTEATMAGALGIQLSGPTEYFGKIVDKPYIGFKHQVFNQKHLEQSLKYVVGVAILSYIQTILIIWW